LSVLPQNENKKGILQIDYSITYYFTRQEVDDQGKLTTYFRVVEYQVRAGLIMYLSAPEQSMSTINSWSWNTSSFHASF
jgi:hypothetical protein